MNECASHGSHGLVALEWAILYNHSHRKGTSVLTVGGQLEPGRRGARWPMTAGGWNPPISCAGGGGVGPFLVGAY